MSFHQPSLFIPSAYLLLLNFEFQIAKKKKKEMKEKQNGERWRKRLYVMNLIISGFLLKLIRHDLKLKV